jgi:hypothetical protein
MEVPFVVRRVEVTIVTMAVVCPVASIGLVSAVVELVVLRSVLPSGLLSKLLLVRIKVSIFFASEVWFVLVVHLVRLVTLVRAGLEGRGLLGLSVFKESSAG